MAELRIAGFSCDNIARMVGVHPSTAKRYTQHIKNFPQKRECSICGGSFQAIRPKHNICSDVCRQKTKKRKKQAKIYHKECIVCSSQFDSKYFSQAYCSTECKKAEQKKRSRERYYAHAPWKPTITKLCRCCGGEFKTNRYRQIYCSPECKVNFLSVKNKRRGSHESFFDGERFKPRNEFEVIFVFAKFHKQLGVKEIKSLKSHTSPDCVAIMEDGSEKRIEFEYKSSNFILHKHDPKGCDMIICWIDDAEKLSIPIIDLLRIKAFVL